ncbi:hypothetical protein Baya_6946 [Bagarius yarrelli]|uniref:Uncharacterized protein n=1 Tax=Bagarius yarrelli TaxID=175774 RepID=A0A556U3D4_BAGYA|nr:hypothetical protein Baya_6946 [Bagarius yarrelli]
MCTDITDSPFDMTGYHFSKLANAVPLFRKPRFTGFLAGLLTLGRLQSSALKEPLLQTDNHASGCRAELTGVMEDPQRVNICIPAQTRVMGNPGENLAFLQPDVG